MSLHDLLIESGALLHVSCAGAGARLVQRIWDRPGTSRYLAGAALPYGKTQLATLLGYQPRGSVVSRAVALELAMASYVAAAELKAAEGKPGAAPVGLAVTAAIASDRIPRGDQRAHIAVVMGGAVRALRVDLEKSIGAEARRLHDEQIANAVLEVLEQAVAGGLPGDDVATEATEALFACPVFGTDGTRSASSRTGLYLPGTLNPLHDGHRAMLCAAEAATGARCRYLVTATSVHKPTLTVPEMLDRVGMVRAERWIGHTSAVEFSRNDPLFVDKAQQRPGSRFVIGADTMARMLDPCWGPTRDEVLAALAAHGAAFLVLGREVDGRFLTCDDIDVPAQFRRMFRHLEGRIDVSSTELRRAAS